MIKIIFSLLFLFSVTSFKSYTNDIEDINPIVITGNAIPKTLKETGSAVTIITSKEIKEKNIKYLTQILSGQPGFQVYNSGGPHTLSRAFKRK